MNDIDEIRETHTRYSDDGEPAICSWCNEPWPCDTGRVLDALDAARADADRLAEALRRSVKASKSVSVLGPGALSTRDMAGSWVAAADALAAHDAGRA